MGAGSSGAGAAGRVGVSASAVERVASTNSVFTGVSEVGEPAGVTAGQRSSSSGSAEKPLRKARQAAAQGGGGGDKFKRLRAHAGPWAPQCCFPPFPAPTITHQEAAQALVAVLGCSEGRKPAAEALRPCWRSLTVCSFLAAAVEARREPAPPPQAGMFECLALAILG